ncbi:GDSL esterase/lipase [Iris pallida]|uniref:GDSL esterase/lipase n=1 Tax=Iris pallida TaxID=29817 RepID=A0AAX6GDG7_IRIPA|nr:GDSL esterase/lipase [Iris pallida]
MDNNKGNSTSRNFNLTWTLPVSDSGHGHLVRLHFCDIVSKALNELYFDIYINGYPASMDVDLSSLASYSLASPYYIDFRLRSSPSATVRVSVGPSARSLPWKSNAILNGLEIMKIRGVAAFSKQRQKEKKSYTRAMLELLLGCSFVVSAFLIFLLTVFRWRGRRRTKQAPVRSESAAWSPLPASSYSRLMELTAATSSPATNASLTLKLPFSDVLLATKNFDENSHIGSGGFGKVYRGVLRDGTAVAVKRGGRDSTDRGSRQGATEFYAEILVLSRIRHRHLVSLVGYCEERSEMILVYEFVERGPLRDHLYGPAAKPRLSWKRRLEICVGSARGLHYLHTGSSQGVVIHRDIKSSNILLDGGYAAKVADFGLSRSAGAHVDRSHVSTGVKGSFGYLDPEYFRTQQLTEKSDVYSFGVVLLEVLCARPVIDRSLPWEEVNLAEWGMKWQKKGLLRRIVDPALKGEVDSESLGKFGETVEKCLSKYGVDRPTMGEVLWNLEYVLQLHESAASREAAEDCSNGSLEIQEVCSTSAQNNSGMATK